MNNTIETPVTDTNKKAKSANAPKTETPLEAAANAQEAKQKAIADQVELELKNYLTACEAADKVARTLGTLCIENLAIFVGYSVNKSGRPSEKAFGPFAKALINFRDKEGNRMGFKQRNRLFEIAQKHVGGMAGEEGYYKPASAEELSKAKQAFVKSSGKALDDKASVTLRMARPAQEAIALGE